MLWLTTFCILLQLTFGRSEVSDSAISCAIKVGTEYLSTDVEEDLVDTYNASAHIEPIENRIEFKLFSREDRTGTKINFKDIESLKKSTFKPQRPTRILTHGYNGRGHDAACVDPKNAFLLMGDFNVIIMDWFRYQSPTGVLPIYSKCVRKVKPAALHLAEMINFLETQGMDLSTLTLIGHSLGSQVVGLAGYNTKNKVNHVVGLDPAEPGFKNKGPGDRISTEDATHVEIIHSNGGHCGMAESAGHYDFYLNGGSKQPGCSDNSCSHSRSYNYYSESIKSSKGFYGKRCIDSKSIGKDECVGELALMGGMRRSSISTGVYFVETNAKSPYAMGRPNRKNFFFRRYT